MTDSLPMFPLNTVLFPGVSVPLRVFEDRYRALVHHLMREPDPTRRMFATVAIREGYEVGDHGAQSLYRVGCRLQLTDVAPHPDGTFDIVAVARDRVRLEELEVSGPFPRGEVELLSDDDVPVPTEIVERARATFTAYRASLVGIRTDPHPGALPKDPEWLAWTLASVAPLPLPDRQSLLEADDTALRLTMVTDLFRAELRAMNVIPSLPATQVARTGWSPN
ncbi:LON peptidase substrate-binding domain-containing protein [Nocardioides pacificus]